MTMSDRYELTVVVPVSGRVDNTLELHRDYAAAFDEADCRVEFIYVLDGEYPGVRKLLGELQREHDNIRVIQLGRWFGEATALRAGFDRAGTDWVMTLPAYYQVDPKSIVQLLNHSTGADLILGRRWPRADSRLNQFLTKAFHRVVSFLTGTHFNDLGSGCRLINKQVIEEVPVYGDQHRFLPILAHSRGFNVVEVDLPQSTKETFHRFPGFGVLPRRVLDLITVFFLVKFTKKPLRFFGLIGAAAAGLGLLLLVAITAQRLFFGVPLADRPALLLASLLVVLGVQLLAIGLVGEIVIFTHATQLKEYTAAEIVNRDGDD